MDELHVYASTHQGVFTIADARKTGLTDKQIRHRREREWRRLYEGVYLAGGAPLDAPRRAAGRVPRRSAERGGFAPCGGRPV